MVKDTLSILQKARLIKEQHQQTVTDDDGLSFLEAMRQSATSLDEAGGNDLETANDAAIEPDPLTVIAYTPLGNPVIVRADSLDHAAFIRRMNPLPETVI